jgi:hypothetical protein
MGSMGIEAIYRKKKVTKTNPEHPVFPYLLRNLVIERRYQYAASNLVDQSIPSKLPDAERLGHRSPCEGCTAGAK